MRKTTIGAGLLAGLLLAAWLFFAPPQIGGSTGYAVLYGVSMEPHLHRGDLVLTRSEAQYDVGDVIAYRSPTLHRTVLHRIVARDGNRFVTKGDNNDFLDPDHPSAGDVVGKRWLRVPGAGTLLLRLRSPAALAIIASLLLLSLAGGGLASRRRRGRETPAIPSLSSGTALQLAAAVAVAAGILAALAFTTAPTRTVQQPGAYELVGTFGYSGAARKGSIYQQPRLASGDPIFFGLVHAVSVRFGYRLDSRLPFLGRSSSRLDAVLTDGKGWRRRFVLQPWSSARGSVGTLRGRLDVDALRRDLRRFEAAVRSGGGYTLTVQPRVAVKGTILGQSVREYFAPALALRVDDTRIWLDSAGSSGAGQPASTLERSKSGTLPGFEPNSIRISKLTLPVRATRRGSAIVLALAVLSLLVLLWRRLAGRKGEEPVRIAARYGDRLVPVEHGIADATGLAVKVSSFESLVALADHYEEPILYEQRGRLHLYAVRHGGAVYHYGAPELAPQRVDGSDVITLGQRARAS
jgi:signal peptidase I